jgi:hypothetical protein
MLSRNCRNRGKLRHSGIGITVCLSKCAGFRYDGEIAFVDSQIQRLSGTLKHRQLYDDTAIIVTSDHGESLGERGEETHGLLLYDSTLHVPLIVKTAKQRLKNRVVAEQARGVDIVPTVLDMVAIPVPARLQGQSLVFLMGGTRNKLGLAAYSETYFPFYHFRWSPLVAMRTEKYKYIEVPSPELYDFERDPAEKRNVLRGNPEVAGRMKESLMMNGFPKFAAASHLQPGKVDAATMRMLKSLGYVVSPSAGGVTEPFRGLPDPKDKIQVYGLLQRALTDSELGRLSESIAKLQTVLREDENILGRPPRSRVDYGLLGEFTQSVEPFHSSECSSLIL